MVKMKGTELENGDGGVRLVGGTAGGENAGRGREAGEMRRRKKKLHVLGLRSVVRCLGKQKRR